MGLFVYTTNVFDVHRHLPFKISLTTSIKMIKIYNKPFYCDSKAFASRFWLTMCSPAGYIYIISFLRSNRLYLWNFQIYFIFFNFRMTCEKNHNWNAWLITSPACYWFGFKKWWGSRRESPPSSFNQGQSWRRSIPRSQVTCIRP